MYLIGIDLGGTNIAVGLVDEDGKVILKDSVPTMRERKYAEIIKDMAALTLKVIKDSGLCVSDVHSIGIGCPGATDDKEGVLIFTPNLKFKNVPLRAEMQKYIDLPVYMDNDANAAGLAESCAGAAKGSRSSILVTLGTGIGGAAVIDGKVYDGFNHAAMEIGHMVIVADGEKCGCGRKGCWEVYASATALIRMTKKALIENPNSIMNKLVNGDLTKVDAKTAFDAKRLGDKVGAQVVSNYIKYVAEGLVNIINIFQPEIIVIGGGVCKEGEYLLEPLNEMVGDMTFSGKYLPHTKIKAAQLGNDAGIVGAALLGKESKIEER